MLALLIDEHIAALSRGELRPTALECPIGCSSDGGIFRDRRRTGGSVITRGLCHARSEEKGEENEGNGRELNSAQCHKTHLLYWLRKEQMEGTLLTAPKLEAREGQLYRSPLSDSSIDR